ncbi:MAG TPA: hypothetical protein VGB53_05660 [Rubricoccaceae bacterium]|jgi:hypothetical protein
MTVEFIPFRARHLEHVLVHLPGQPGAAPAQVAGQVVARYIAGTPVLVECEDGERRWVHDADLSPATSADGPVDGPTRPAA